MSVKYSNNATTTLAANVSSGATSFTVASATNFPTLGGSDWCWISLNDEVVKVTAISGTTFTCLATSESHSSGDSVELRMTYELLNDFLEDTEGLPLSGGTLTGTLTATDFIGPLDGPVRFKAKNDEGLAITAGQAVYIKGISGNTPTVGLADADDSSKMPAFGLVYANANNNAAVEIVTFGTLGNIKTDYSGWSLGDTLYISTTAGTLTNSAPTGETAQIQNIGYLQRVHGTAGSIKVGGAGRTNATPNLNDGNVFIGNASNQSVARALQIADTTGLQTALDGKTTETYVDTAVAGLVDSAPTTLDTLNELAAALGDDPNFATTVTNQIATKANSTDVYTKTQLDGGQLDNRYYTETEVNTALAGKSDTSHTHDGRYYTETEVDTALAGKEDVGTAVAMAIALG